MYHSSVLNRQLRENPGLAAVKHTVTLVPWTRDLATGQVHQKDLELSRRDDATTPTDDATFWKDDATVLVTVSSAYTNLTT